MVRVEDTSYEFRVEIQSGKEVKIRPLESEYQLKLYACASPLTPTYEFIKNLRDPNDSNVIIAVAHEYLCK